MPMRIIRVAIPHVTIMVFAAAAAVPVCAQEAMDAATQAQILQELRALRERVEKLEQENRALRGEPAPPPAAAEKPPDATPAEEPPAAIAGAEEPVAEPESRITAGYDKNAVNGFFIGDESGEFRLNIGGYTQVRYNTNWRNGVPPDEHEFTQGFSVNRTRFFFEGQYTDPLKYHLRLNIDDSGATDLIAAYLQYAFTPNWGIRVGEQFMALSREDWMYAQDVLGLEFSPNDFTFAIGSSIGIQPQYVSDRYRYWFGLSNGAFGGKESFPSVDVADLTFTGRYEYQFGTTDWSIWDDLVGRKGRDQGILLGIAGAYQFDRKESGTTVDNATELIGDVSFSGDGYQAMISGTWLYVEPTGGGDHFSNYGLLVQGGYFLTENFQLYGRYDWISPGDRPGDLVDFNDIALGVNYFPFVRTNRWKFSGELAYLFEALDRTIVAPSGSLGWLSAADPGQVSLRLQAQFGF